MKKTVMIAAAVVGLMATASFAQMGGGMGGQHRQEGTMGSRQGHKMMDDRMMGQEMMRDMSGMMKQMNGMMQKMSGAMEDGEGMSHANMTNMAQMMNDMSVTMKEMSEQMAAGRMDPAVMDRIQERMKGLDMKMENMGKD